MCYIITGTLPLKAELERVRRIKGPEGSAWAPLAKSPVVQQLPRSVGYFHVTGSWCDCESGLSVQVRRRWRRSHLPKAAKRWSQAKRERWLQQVRGHAGPMRGDVAAWREYVSQLLRVTEGGPVGLLVHWYERGFQDEDFPVRVAPVARLADHADFAALDDDVLYQYA